MRERIRNLLKNFRLPGIYIVFPGWWEKRTDPRGEEIKRNHKAENEEIEIPLQPALIIDTSALIDGRIADIVETGFVSGTFIIPSFVLKELQEVADSKDPIKRNRGRRGLDVLNSLRKSHYVKFKLIKGSYSNKEAIDSQLLQLGKRLKGRVITMDYNLNKVGKVSGVPILNINELANMVKTILLPGEEFEVSVLKEGKEKNQGIGYLPDGTMVIVENGNHLIGEEVRVRVDKLWQTEAGKMIFTTPSTVVSRQPSLSMQEEVKQI